MTPVPFGESFSQKRLSFRALVVGSSYLYNGGSSVILRNLLRQFSVENTVIGALGRRRPYFFDSRLYPTSHTVMEPLFFGSKIGQILSFMQVPLATERIKNLAISKMCRIIVGTYPNIFLLSAAHRAASELGLPFVAYLHDTIAESMHASPFSQFAKMVQDDVFRDADHLFVMSEGMADLYRQKYGIDAEPLIHPYPEPILEPPSFQPDPVAFWSGAIYSINQNSFRRIAAAIHKETPLNFTIATKQDKTSLIRLGLNMERADRTFFTGRPKYLRFLRKVSLNILALDWPDESPVHRDELRTIFPTKTVEYLASGRPIIAHCPDDYFLAKFIRQHECGEVVSSRHPEAFKHAFAKLQTNPSLIEKYVKNALAAAKDFQIDRVAQLFKTRIEHVAANTFDSREN